MPSDPRSSLRWAWAGVVVHAGGWVSVAVLPPDSWAAFWLSVAPPFAFAIPGLGVGMWLVWRRRGRAGFAWFACALALAGMISGFHFSGASRGMGFTALTWNLQAGAGGVPRIRRSLRKIDPDIACFQEVGSGYHIPKLIQELHSALPRHRWVRRGEMAVATRGEIAHVETLNLGAGVASRGGLLVRTTQGGRDLYVACMHLAPLQPGLVFRKPGQSARMIADYVQAQRTQTARLKSYLAGRREPWLLMGDFNTPSYGGSFRSMTRLGRDAFDTAGFGFGFTAPAKLPMVRPDAIFVGPGLQASSARVLPRGPSDHRAVLAEIAWTGATAARE